MKEKIIGFVLAAGLLLAVSAIAQQNKQADIELQAAIRTETVNGDLKSAIKQYEAIVAKYGKDRGVAASALIHIAECYQKLGDKESQKVYERIVRDFGDQKDAADKASSRLAALRSQGTSQGIQAARRIWTNMGVTVTPPSADGRYLAFYDKNSGDVAIRDLKESTSRRITNAAGSGERGLSRG